MTSFRLRPSIQPGSGPAATPWLRRGGRTHGDRRLVHVAAVLGALGAIVALALPTAAGAAITEGFGVQSRAGINLKTLLGNGPLKYHGGPVLHSSDVYVIYWDPQGVYRGDWERLIDGFFKHAGEDSGKLSNVFALDGQYLDAGGRASNQLTFRGSVKDTDPYPTTAEGGNCEETPANPEEKATNPLPTPVCLTDRQIRAELQHVISSVAPPLPGASGTPIYYILTPPGVNVCTDKGSKNTCAFSTGLEKETEEKLSPVAGGLCGYHAVLSPESATPIPYVVQPWVAGDAGQVILKENPLVTSGATSDVLACQDNRLLEEPNQLSGLNPFGNFAEGLADVIINDLSIEQRDVVTDPLLNGWFQSTTNAEQGDMTQFNFGPPPPTLPAPNNETHAANLSDETIASASYYVSWAFASAEFAKSGKFGGWSGVALEPFFTSPNPVDSGDIVGFNATESNITLDAPAGGLPADEPYTAPVYSWNFGDGSTASGTLDASAFHSYQYGGTYNVTLAITDSGGNTQSTTSAISVVGPPPPGGAGGSAGGGAAGSSAGAGGASGGPAPGGGTAGVPKPLASDAVLSRKFRTVARNGLVVRYSVNEQVAGRFEVMLSRSLAARLGIGGPAASGLPLGSPPEVVIGRAIVVTQKGGRGTIHITLSRRTNQRLARLRKATLMLRFVVRNAARVPTSTTVLSTFTLTR